MTFHRIHATLILGLITLLVQGNALAWPDFTAVEAAAHASLSEWRSECGLAGPLAPPEPRASITAQPHRRSAALYNRSSLAGSLLWLERLAKRITCDVFSDPVVAPVMLALDVRLRHAAAAHRDHPITEVSRRGLHTSGRHPPQL